MSEKYDENSPDACAEREATVAYIEHIASRVKRDDLLRGSLLRLASHIRDRMHLGASEGC